MWRKKGPLVIALAAVFSTAVLARAPEVLSSIQEKAKADAATPEGQTYLKQFFTNPWMLALDAADDQCRGEQLRSGSPPDFILALVIADTGYPTDVLVSPENEGLKCVADRLKATSFIKPPHDGFAIYMPFKATEPGSEHQHVSSLPDSGESR